MPVDIQVRVEIPQRIREAVAKAPQMVVEEFRKTMDIAVKLVEGAVKERITEIHLIDTGLLRSSIHGQVESASIQRTVGVIGTNVIYARIHEFGGTIVPKNGQALAIPINKESAQLQAQVGSLRNVPGLHVLRRAHGATGGTGLLVSSTNMNLAWALVKSVHIHEKRYLRGGLEQSKPQVMQLFRDAAKRVLEAIFGKGGE